MTRSDRELSGYLVAWSVNGLDTLFDATLWHKKKTWSVLTCGNEPCGPDFMSLIVRASSSDLKYEIYDFESELTENQIRLMFHSDETTIKNIIREQGTLLFGKI